MQSACVLLCLPAVIFVRSFDLDHLDVNKVKIAYETFKKSNKCESQRDIPAVRESNQIFDANWNADTGEVHESMRAVLTKDQDAYYFMIKRSFESGVNYVKAEVAYTDCLIKSLRKKRSGLGQYLDILKGVGLYESDAASMKYLLSALFVTIGFEKSKLLVPQHLNELTVERMQTAIPKHLKGEKLKIALNVVAAYAKSLSTLNHRILKLGRLLNEYFEDQEL